MRAIQAYRDQGVHVLLLETPLASADEVLIRTCFSAVNYKDALAVTGRGKILQDFPMIPGIDLVGVVESDHHADFVRGDEVIVTGCGLGERFDGGYAEYVRVAARHVIKKPDNLTLKDCIILGTAGFTAAYAVTRLEENGLQPGQGDVLVTGASGGVGSIAVSILAKRGYRVVAMSGKPSEQDWLGQLGAAEIIPRHDNEARPRPLESTRWAGAVDNSGGDTLAWLLATTQPLGSVAAIGLAAGFKLNTTVMPFILRGINLLGINSVDCPIERRRALWDRLATDFRIETLASIHTATLSLDEVPAYCESMLAGKTTGRAIVKLS